MIRDIQAELVVNRAVTIGTFVGMMRLAFGGTRWDVVLAFAIGAAIGGWMGYRSLMRKLRDRGSEVAQ